MNEVPSAQRRLAMRAAPWLAIAGFAALGVSWLRQVDDSPSVTVANAPSASAPVAAASAGEATVVAMATARSTAASRGSEEVQVCGGGWLRTDGDKEQLDKDVSALEAARFEAVREPTLAAMRASADERVQAAAAYYEAAVARLRPVVVGSCKDSADCTRKSDAHSQAPEKYRDILARIAQSSSDPIVYGWAHAACSKARGAFDCQAIHAAQWARLDADNAVPWLALAAQARAQGDQAAEDDAMFHVASAIRLDEGEARLAATLLDHVPVGESNVIGAANLAVDAIGIAAVDANHSLPILLYCQVWDLADANRRETCDRMARLAVERGTSLQAHYAGIAIGKRVGWPVAQLKSLEDGRRAYEAYVMSRPTETPTSMLGCDPLQNLVRDIREHAELGQVEAARRSVASSGRSAKDPNRVATN